MRAFNLLVHHNMSKLFTLICVGLALSGCTKKGSVDTSLSSFGLNIVVVSGNNQIGGADKLFANPLRVQVINDSGEGVKDLKVTFQETTATNLLITLPVATTASDGTAQTSVRAPPVYNQQSILKACIQGSTECATFHLSSATSTQAVKYVLYTEHSDNEVAGVPFHVTLKTQGADDDALIDINQDIDIQWTFITASSWSNVAPTNVPVTGICTFVHGVCALATPITLTDARVTTKVFVGDGDGGNIDVFAHLINVAVNSATNTVVTDKAGGPLAGAKTIVNTVFTADDADFNFYSAITDVVGNYIADATNVTWSTDHPLEMTSHLSTLTGASTILNFQESIPFPNFGVITATAAGYTPGSTGHLSIDPGVPVNAKVVPKDGNYTRVAGDPMDFDFNVTDAEGNIVGQKFGSSGFTGTFPVTVTFSNYFTPPNPTGGTIPLLKSPGTNVAPTVSKTLTIPFYAGKAQFINQQITFWDATGVTPHVAAAIDTTSEPIFPDLITGGSDYNVTMNMDPTTWHIMLRDGPGPTAQPLCMQNFTGSQSNWIQLPDIILTNYLSPLKGNCTGINIQSDAAPVQMYASIEDQAGNFIANLSVNWITTDPDITVVPSDLGGLHLATLSGPVNTLYPLSVTGVLNQNRWLRLQGTYGGLNYDQYFLGGIRPGNLAIIELRVRHQGLYPNNQADASIANDLVIVPKDVNGNELTQDMTRNMTVTVSGTFNNGLDGTTPVFVSSGSTSIFFSHFYNAPRYNVSNSTALGHFPNLVTPHAGDVVNVTVTDNANPLITDTIAWTVIPGPAASVHIYKDLDFPWGTDVTNQPVSVTTDQNITFFSVPFDAHLNLVPADPSYTAWDTSPQPFPALAVSGLISVGSQTPFTPDKPSSGKLKVTKSTPTDPVSLPVSGQTGVITILPGAPSKINVSLNPSIYNITAGVPQDVIADILDAKFNRVTTINAMTNIAITVLNNDFTRLLYTQYTPPSGNYMFTAGEHIFTGSEAFKFYNSLYQPRVQISTTNATPIVGQSLAITVAPNSFDHLALLSQNIFVDAGVPNVYTIISEDAYGNKIISGAAASKHVVFNISSTLGAEDIQASDLAAADISDFSPLNQKTITGDLTNGRATVTLASTAAGLLTVTGSTTGIVGTNTTDALTVRPLTSVTAVRYKPGSTPQSPATTTQALYPFTVEALDAFGNVITSNNTDKIALQLIGATQTLGNYTDQTLVAGAAGFSGLTYKKAESFTLRAKYLPDPTKFYDWPMTVQIGSINRTVPVLPNQTWVEGQGSLAAAVTGTPFSTGTVTAGTTFNVTVHAVDDAFNTVTTYTGPVSLTSTDPYLEVTPASQNFVSGLATFSVKVRKQGAVHNITAVTPFTDEVSTSYAVGVAAATQLVALLPTQTLLEGAPDLVTALNGTVPFQTAGVGFGATVKAVDAYYNQVTTYNHGDISLTFNNDPNAPALLHKAMSGGSVNFTPVGYKAIPGQTLTPATASGAMLTSQLSSQYEIKANSATQYIAVFPGQTLNSGKAPGAYASAVTGTPSAQTTDNGFSVNLYAVDDYFNVRLDYAGTVSIATPSDPNANTPVGVNAGHFVSGAETFTINPVKAVAGQTITVTTTGLTANTPANYTVSPGAPSKLIALFTDYQTLDQGHLTLPSALNDVTVHNRTSGEVVAVRVYATDTKFNVVNDNTTSVSLNPTITNNLVSPASKTLTAGIADFTVATYLVGNAYHITPAGSGYAVNASTDYNVLIGTGKFLLVILPGQTFMPGQATSAAAASGNPYNQTLGASFPFNARVISVDDYFNERTTDTSTVTLAPSLAATVTVNPKALVAGETTFSLSHTSSGNAATVSATSGGYTSVASKAYDVQAALANPTISLSDPTTSNTSYIRSTSVNTSIGSDATANRWCVSETQSTRPTSGTNGRTTCNGGGGSDQGWYTARPPSVTTTGSAGGKTLYVWVADSANNVNVTAGSASITLDSTPPNNPSAMTLTSATPVSTSYTRVASVSLQVTLSGDTVKYCKIEQATASAAPTAPLYNDACWAAVPGFPVSYTISTTGDRKLYVFAKDIAENVSLAAASVSMIYDNTAPTAPAITGVKGNLDTVADNYLGTTLVPNLVWSAATDTTAITYTATIKDSGGGATICGPSTTASTSYNFTGCNLVDGTAYTAFVTATDSAGNATAASNNGFAFTVDNTPPATFTVTGMDGGTDSTVDAFLTDLSSPRLNWNATTGHTGYNVYIFTNAMVQVPNCLASTGAGATSYTGFVGCTLADNTTYKMRVIAFDAAGNTTEASNSPFSFQTSQGIHHFDVTLVPATDPVAGAYFSVQLTARKQNLTVATSYVGSHTVNWSTTAAAGTDTCLTAQNMAVEMPTGTLFFTAGTVTTGSVFAMKAVGSGKTLTATDASAFTGTSPTFNITAAAQACARIETAAGGGGAALAAQTPAIDGVVNAFAVSRDTYGNYLGNPSVAWTGTGVLSGLPIPETGSSTQIVGVKAGTGTLLANAVAALAVNFTVGTGNVTWTAATPDTDAHNLLANNSVTSVFYWNVLADATTGFRTAASSWHSEASSANRGVRADFPTEAILVGSNSGLDIIDASNNKLFMRFQAGANKAIDTTYGNIVDITALNGKIYVSMNNGAGTGALIIIDLAGDAVYSSNHFGSRLAVNNIASRNSASTWNADVTYPMVTNTLIGKLVSRRISGVDYVAMATDFGVELMQVSGTKSDYKYTTASAVKSVALTAAGKLYFSTDTVGTSRADLTLPLSADFTPTVTYTMATNAKTLSLTFNDIGVAEGTSSVDSGNNTLIVATNVGLTVIQEHATFASATSVTYGKAGTGTAGATGLFAGASEIVKNIDVVTIAGLVDVHMVTVNGWSELRNVQSGSATLGASDTTISPADVKAYHSDAYNDNDVILGLAASGLHLKRR